MKKLIFILSALLFLAGTTDVQAQWGKKLLKKAGESAKKATEKNVERKIEKAVDKAFDGAEDAVTGKGNDSKSETKTSTNPQGDVEVIGDDGAEGQQEQPLKQTKQSLEATYAKSDFVPGDEIIFDDDLSHEQLGEFPSKWDLLDGNAEVAQLGGAKAIYFTEGGTTIIPLMENPQNYLPDVYTIEIDVYISGSKTSYSDVDDRTYSRYRITFYEKEKYKSSTWDLYDFGNSADYSFRRPGGDNVDGSYKAKPLIILNDWNHIAFSFNKRAFKAYINGTRVTNIPNTVHHTWFSVYRHNYAHHTKCYIRNIRIAKGAVPLYDRMMSDGKFITYGITFDVGKSTIKPESMGEINRIVTLMKENPDLKFSVEGHTDSTGNEASNHTLSEARSNAIVDKLVELGISADRLSASGKGQTSPIADNGTDEGRAKNRRVEFVKI